ncbi:hypothetical protein MDA_GLEAN10018101 [Myotis davidii]|uniref:Uncharacterized protein n=1 Tax=Myotis davidii TaxID=225400 RepID=L5LGT9_MYODS|nr:hypothetical protein MDA_GLEAN10018101 [Myotis davidii]
MQPEEPEYHPRNKVPCHRAPAASPPRLLREPDPLDQQSPTFRTSRTASWRRCFRPPPSWDHEELHPLQLAAS